jgi:alpha-glucosidase
MNEPSVFDVPSKTIPDDVVFHDNGLQSPETKIHNVYGMQMSRATREGLLKLKPNERPLGDCTRYLRGRPALRRRLDGR